MKGRAAAGAILTAIAAVGCGPLVSTPVYETPLLSFDAILTDIPGTVDLAQLNIGIVWVDPLALRDDLPQPPTGITVTRPADAADRKFTVDLFAAPPDAAIRRLPDPTTHELAVSFAFGEIIVYDDGGGDGAFAISSREHGSLMFPPDAYRGSSDRRAVVYVEKPAVPGALSGNIWRTLTEGPGYRFVNVNCNSVPVAVTTLEPPDQSANLSVERMSSPELIVTRPCLSPTRPAIDTMP